MHIFIRKYLLNTHLKCLALSSFAYERICVLFNIAAQQSAVAATQNLDTDEGLKIAAKYLQVK